MTQAIARARSFLFVPASRPERIPKALESAAGAVILDLEDAVAPDQKAQARVQIGELLAGIGQDQLVRTLVRINAVGTPWHDEDVRALREWCARGLAGAMVPKAESPAALDTISSQVGAAGVLVPLIETLGGFDAAHLIARSRQVARLAFGNIDFQLDLGMRCGPDEVELTQVRFALVAASRREQLPAPVDGVTQNTSDAERLAADCARSRAFGFGAKLCIHPAQLAQVNAVFSPTEAELDWARRVVEAARTHRNAVFSLDGKMVDVPVVRLAERTLKQAQA
jgi:citrate lyase subunit beta/citryl-CoA lyase